MRPRTAIAVGAIILVAFSVTIGAWLYPHDPNFQVLEDRYLGPSLEHPFGTDRLGRDLLARVLAGGGVSLMASALSVILALIGGTFLGILAGYRGRAVDGFFSRIFDALQVIPGLVLLIALAGVLGRGVDSVILGLGILYSIKIFRVARAVTASIRTEVYVDASVAMGGSASHVMGRHILVGALAPLLVQATILVGWGVVAETGLSYLGLGVQPPNASLGSILAEGAVSMSQSPWLIVFPGLFIAVVTLSLFTVGDALRGALGRPIGGTGEA